MKYLLVIIMVLSTFSVNADDSEAEKLIQGCNELVSIYKNHNDKRLLASMLASSSDAMLAGYCMGVTKTLTGFGKRECGGRDWYELAEVIAEKWKVKSQNISVNRALGNICRG
jgi:hypothetical protein|tara:strand:+ start:342 stop:680 length:339 start_codon:yes stop_codon:yes gene_type:complete